MLRRTLLLAAFLCAAAGPADARVGVGTLARLVEGSEVIVVARVDEIRTVGGVRLAFATTERRLTEFAPDRFAFLAQATWACDDSTAAEGERALLFLKEPGLNGFLRDFLVRYPNFLPELKAQSEDGWLYQLAWHGSGRLPLCMVDGRDFGQVYLGRGLHDPGRTVARMGHIELPREVPFTAEGRHGSALVPLDAVEAAVRALLGAAPASALRAQPPAPPSRSGLALVIGALAGLLLAAAPAFWLTRRATGR